MNSEQLSTRNYAIDFFRFAFAVAIVYFHVLHGSIMPYVKGIDIYARLGELSTLGANIVECFFIMSGFFFAKTWHRHTNESMFEFAKHRFARLWPVLAFYFVVMTIFFGGRFYQLVYNVCFLQCIGLTADMKGITWYVSPLFWASLFYFGLFKSVSSPVRRNLIIAILVYFAYMANMTAVKGGFSRVVSYGVVSLALARGIGGIGMGILISEWHDAIELKRDESVCWGEVIIYTLLEICSLSLLFVDFFYKPLANNNQFVVVIAFSLFILATAIGKGVVSRMLNRRWLAFPGRYSYSIYIMQSVSFLLLSKWFWRPFQEFVQTNVIVTLTISVAFATLVGIIVYYAIEKPMARLLEARPDVPRSDCRLQRRGRLGEASSACGSMDLSTPPSTLSAR